MENQETIETPEQKRIKDLEAELLNTNSERDTLIFINLKLGYSLRLMSEFHLSQDDKIDIGDVFDSAKDSDEVKNIYVNYQKRFFNKALADETGDFQWSPGFKDKLRHYFAVSIGYDIISEVGDSLSVIADYFALENKIRTTPDAALRQPMTEKLLKDREQTLIAMDKMIDLINSFNEDS